jgi:ureidoacrylate peracid hydrolase
VSGRPGGARPATALLLIDLQNEVLHPDGKMRGDLPAGADRLVAAVRDLVVWARARAHPVIWVRMAFRPGLVDAARGVREGTSATAGRLVDGTWGAEILDGIGREPEDIVVTKKRSSAFFNTDLDFVLNGLGVRRLVVGGTSTNWAIESTVRDGDSRDLEMIVVREATASRMAELHESSLRSMASRYARVLTLEQVRGLGDA